jgi:cbb3-type cytochrome oxidase subunit 3
MQNMQDIVFVAATIAFFLISIAYVKFCDRIR